MERPSGPQVHFWSTDVLILSREERGERALSPKPGRLLAYLKLT